VNDPEFHQLSKRLAVWHRYDSAVKTELFSTALVTAAGIYIVDPTLLTDDQFQLLAQTAPAAGVVITNANHTRAVVEFSERLSVPIFAAPNALADSTLKNAHQTGDGVVLPGGLEIIEISGAAPGEIALHHADDGGTLIIGDAVINLEPYGFTLLPRKYCENQNEMRRALRKLLDRPAQRLLFAHGTPVLSAGTDHLRQLLDDDA
jgi:hypothetical protein